MVGSTEATPLQQSTRAHAPVPVAPLLERARDAGACHACARVPSDCRGVSCGARTDRWRGSHLHLPRREAMATCSRRRNTHKDVGPRSACRATHAPSCGKQRGGAVEDPDRGADERGLRVEGCRVPPGEVLLPQRRPLGLAQLGPLEVPRVVVQLLQAAVLARLASSLGFFAPIGRGPCRHTDAQGLPLHNAGRSAFSQDGLPKPATTWATATSLLAAPSGAPPFLDEMKRRRKPRWPTSAAAKRRAELCATTLNDTFSFHSITWARLDQRPPLGGVSRKTH